MALTEYNRYRIWPSPRIIVTQKDRYPKWPLPNMGVIQKTRSQERSLSSDRFRIWTFEKDWSSNHRPFNFFGRFSMRMTLFNPSNNMKTLLFRHVRASRYHVIILKSRDINGSCSSPLLHYLILNENILSFKFSFSSVHGLTWIFISTL